MTRSANLPPLPQVEVTVPQWRALTRARRRMDVLRSATGRLATLAGAAAAGVGLFTGEFTGASLAADAVLTLGGLASLRLWKPDGHQKATATVLYLTPGVSLAGLLLAEQIAPGPHWAEALGLGVWVVGVLVTRPARLARHMLAPPPAAASLDLAPVAEPVGHPACQWWAQHVAVEAGTAPDTVLENVQRTGEKSMRAMIRSTIPGQPVPGISIKRLSALMDIPEEDIDIDGVPGRGAGVRLLTIGAPEEGSDPATVWAERIAPAAMPGAVLTGVRTGRPGAARSTPPADRTEDDA